MPVAEAPTATIRWLSKSEHRLLQADYDLYGEPLPDDNASVLGLFAPDGRLIGHMAFFSLPAMGIVHVAEEFRHKGAFEIMSAAAESAFHSGEHLFTVADQRARAVLEQFGFTRVEGQLYRRDF